MWTWNKTVLYFSHVLSSPTVTSRNFISDNFLDRPTNTVILYSSYSFETSEYVYFIDPNEKKSKFWLILLFKSCV